MLRDYLADEIASADPNVILASEKYNFMAKGDFGCVANNYILSEGSLPVMGAGCDMFNTWLSPSGGTLAATPTYQQVCDFLGIQQGDQLTFIWTLGQQNRDNPYLPFFTGLKIARVIMEPRDGKPMSTPFFGADQKTINEPNPANEGYIEFGKLTDEATNTDRLTFDLIENYTAAGEGMYKHVGAAVILSRRVGNQWFRSTEKLALNDPQSGYNQLKGAYLGDAVLSYMSEANSSLYLNQAQR